VARLRSFRDLIRTSWWGLILSDHDTEPTELAGGLLKLALATVLVMPTDTFGERRIYGLLANLPEPFWACLLFTLGIVHLAVLRHGNLHWRRLMALAGFVIWFTWSASFFLGNPSNTGGAVYMLAALGSGWCYVRLGGAR
jgi:hypothetical protein